MNKQKASALVNFRIIPGDTQETVIQHVKNVLNDERITIEPVPGTHLLSITHPLSLVQFVNC
jgi:acetylornithine deacetylase/succinyl-diaminopimelate desuccinylase-like protein